MFYGVCKKGFVYHIVSSEIAEDLFRKDNCEAVFDTFKNADAYCDWLNA